MKLNSNVAFHKIHTSIGLACYFKRDYKIYTFLNNDVYRSATTDTAVSTAGVPANYTEPSNTSIQVRKNYDAIKSNPALLPSQIEKKKTDELSYSLRIVTTSKELFDVYLQNKIRYEIQHYLLSIERLAQLLKSGKNTPDSLHQSTVFESLCYDIWKITPQLEYWMVLNLFRDLLNLKVSTSFLIMQSLLQMMRHQLNLLSIKECIFLNELLAQTEDCNLKKALQLAIPKVIENGINVHFPLKLKFCEAMQLLRICISGEVKCFWRVLNHIYKSCLPELLATQQNPHDLNFHLVSLVSNLCDLICNENVLLLEKDITVTEQLLVNCFDKLVENEIDGIPEDLVVIILKKLSNSFLRDRGRCVYNENFLRKVVEKALAEEWREQSVFKVIEYQLKLHYVNDELVSYIMPSLLNPEKLSELKTRISVPPLVSGLAASIQPHEDVARVFSLLMTDYAFPTDNIRIPWIRFALNLLSFNYFPQKLIQELMNEDFLTRYLAYRINTRRELTDLLRLEKSLQMENYKPDFKLPKMIRILAEQQMSGPRPDLLLGKIIQSVIGRPYSLASNVITPNKNCIDHLLVLDSEGSPKEYLVEGCDTENIAFEDLHIPAEDKKIAIMEIPEYWTYTPGSKMRGSYKMELKLLEREGFEVLPLHEREIDDEEPAKVILYIRHQLKLLVNLY